MIQIDRAALIAAAAKVRLNARVEQGSGFHVGAALLCTDGTVFTGCNLEIYGTRASICAERCALLKAVSEGHRDFVAIAVTSDAPQPISPCGICRQFLVDFNPDLLVIMATADGSQVVEKTISELLPMTCPTSEWE